MSEQDDFIDNLEASAAETEASDEGGVVVWRGVGACKGRKGGGALKGGRDGDDNGLPGLVGGCEAVSSPSTRRW